jgi:hypothetical protein
VRERDIVERTGHAFLRIEVTHSDGSARSLAEVLAETDAVVAEIVRRKDEARRRGTFEPWDFEHRYAPERYLARGEITVDGNVLVRRQVDAMRLFGFTGRGWQRGVWFIPGAGGECLWFPRLYEHGMWRNELTAGGTCILERALGEEGRASIRQQRTSARWAESEGNVVFARRRDVLGFDMYRYVGTFRMNRNDADEDCIRFDRIRDAERVGAHRRLAASVP